MTRPRLVAIWVALLSLLGASLLLSYLGNVRLAVTLIFGVAVLKAVLVAAYYMRLKWEARYVLWILFGGLACVLILYFTLVPDIIYVYGG